MSTATTWTPAAGDSTAGTWSPLGPVQLDYLLCQLDGTLLIDLDGFGIDIGGGYDSGAGTTATTWIVGQ